MKEIGSASNGVSKPHIVIDSSEEREQKGKQDHLEGEEMRILQLGQLELGGGGGISDGDIELEIEFILEEVVNVPALAGPASPLRIRSGDPEPVVILGFVHRRVGDQRLVLLLQPLRPGGAVAGAGLRCQQRDLRER
nr:hypothetical protein Iba_chr01eCG4510 [Ipomoea batatas]